MTVPQSSAADRVWVDEAVGQMAPSPYAYAMVALCAAIGMAEGYDAQLMAFAAPLVAREWGLSSGAVGALLAASIVAMVLANFVLAPLGDKWGRRPAILGALALVAAASGAGAFAPDFGWLLAFRALAGLGLGLAFPTVIALAMELMPRRLHAMSVVVVGCGYPIGGAVGGLIAAGLIDDHGYPAVFLLGGFATAALFLLCLPFLPESPLWLARHAPQRPALPRLLARLGVPASPGTSMFGIKAPPVGRSSVAALFSDGRRARTLLMWLINFANLSMVYYYIIWLPSILVNAGMTPSSAASALAMFSGSGVIGGLVLGALLRRAGPARVLGGAYGAAALFILVLAMTPVTADGFLALLAVSATVTIGSQFCLTAVVNQYYPSDIRITAAGWAGGVGRLGAIAAPAIGAAIVHADGSYWIAIGAGVVPAVVAFLTLIILVFAAPLNLDERQ